MRIRRFRKGKSPAQGHTQVKVGAGIKPGLIQKPKSFFLIFLNFKKIKLIFHITEFLHAQCNQRSMEINNNNSSSSNKNNNDSNDIKASLPRTFLLHA